MPYVYLGYDDLDALIALTSSDDAYAAVQPDQRRLDVLETRFKEARAEPSDRDRAIVELAREQYQESGSVEIDDPIDGIAVVSEGDEGAYVLAWVYVDLAGTDLDNDAEGVEQEDET